MKRYLSHAWLTPAVAVVLAACGAGGANMYAGPPLREPAYQLGVADVISITVKDNPGFSTQAAMVRPDGHVTLPLIDDVKVVGSTPAQVKDEVIRKLATFIKTPIVTVTLVELRSYEFFVIGNVGAPNRYASGRLVTVIQALAMAGGLTDFANPDDIRLIRQFPDGQKIVPFDYSAVTSGAKIEQNIYLQSGDTVVVP